MDVRHIQIKGQDEPVLNNGHHEGFRAIPEIPATGLCCPVDSDKQLLYGDACYGKLSLRQPYRS